MIAKLAPTFRRFIDHAKNITLLGAIAAGCVYGYAFAISPTVDTGRTFAGGVNLIASPNVGNNPVYTVPAGKQFTLTDVIISDNSGTAFGTNGRVSIDNDGSCGIGSILRLANVHVPSDGTLHLPLVTGLGFGPGKTVCIFSEDSSYWTLRGYLSNDS